MKSLLVDPKHYQYSLLHSNLTENENSIFARDNTSVDLTVARNVESRNPRTYITIFLYTRCTKVVPLVCFTFFSKTARNFKAKIVSYIRCFRLRLYDKL